MNESPYGLTNNSKIIFDYIVPLPNLYHPRVKGVLLAAGAFLLTVELLFTVR